MTINGRGERCGVLCARRRAARCVRAGPAAPHLLPLRRVERDVGSMGGGDGGAGCHVGSAFATSSPSLAPAHARRGDHRRSDR
eukprot:gene28857-50757_t